MKLPLDDYYDLGDQCLVVRFGNEISLELSEQVLSFFNSIGLISGLLDIVPTYTDLAFYYDKNLLSRKQLLEYLSSVDIKTADRDTHLHHVPVIYNGMDLSLIAKQKSMSIEDLISLHKESEYRIAMIGFQEYFPYLIGLNPKLKSPRLAIPRMKVPAGSLAIGGAQTGIYPSDSPGGWNLIGTVNPDLCKNFKAGDRIKFVEVENEDQL